MSKPDSKQSHYSEKINPKETGTWTAGIRNQEMLLLFGELISNWVYVEESMIDVLNLLIFPDSDSQFEIAKKSRGFSPGQQIFRSIGSNGGRAKVMLSLLKSFPGNDRKKLDPLFARLISEFQSLVNLRNEFLHGLWWTKADGHVYLQTENTEETAWNRKRRIPKRDFESFQQRCAQLARDINAAELKEYRLSGERREQLMKRAAFQRKR